MAHNRKQCISFFVSSECNLECRYCYIPKVGPSINPIDRTIDLAFAVAGMKDYFGRGARPAIRYFSAGEATTAFPLMEEIREQATRLVGQRVHVELQTNGFFNHQVGDWIERNVDVLWISCDGPDDLQDRNRPTVGGGRSSWLVNQQIERFAQCKSMQFGVRATFMPQDFDKQIDVIEYFRRKGVRYVCGAPAYSSCVNDKVDVPLLLEFARQFVPAFEHALRLGMFYQTHLMVNFDEKVESYCRACTKPACPQLTSDGYVSCCDWASFGPKYLPGPLQQCIYGKWNAQTGRIDYFEERQSRIESRNTTRLGAGDCKGCSMLQHCAGGCIGKVMSRSGDLHRMDENWCTAVRYLGKCLPLAAGNYPVFHS